MPPQDLKRPTIKKNKKPMHCVNFFGTNEFAWIVEDCILDYEKYKDLFINKSLYPGKLTMVTVINFKYKKPTVDELDKAAPVRKEGGDLWMCPFCGQNDFVELCQVWTHFDARDEESGCRGKCYGVSVQLDNGITGFININNFSDKDVLNPEMLVKRGQRIYARLLAIKTNSEGFYVMCSSKSSDLRDEDNDKQTKQMTQVIDEVEAYLKHR